MISRCCCGAAPVGAPLLWFAVDVCEAARRGSGRGSMRDGSGRSLTAMRKSNSRAGWGKRSSGEGKWFRDRWWNSSTERLGLCEGG